MWGANHYSGRRYSDCFYYYFPNSTHGPKKTFLTYSESERFICGSRKRWIWNFRFTKVKIGLGISARVQHSLFVLSTCCLQPLEVSWADSWVVSTALFFSVCVFAPWSAGILWTFWPTFLWRSRVRACVLACEDHCQLAPLVLLPYCTAEMLYCCFVRTQNCLSALMFVLIFLEFRLLLTVWLEKVNRGKAWQHCNSAAFISRCFKESYSRELRFNGDPWIACAHCVHSMNNWKKSAFRHAAGKSSIVTKQDGREP